MKTRILTAVLIGMTTAAARAQLNTTQMDWEIQSQLNMHDQGQQHQQFTPGKPSERTQEHDQAELDAYRATIRAAQLQEEQLKMQQQQILDSKYEQLRAAIADQRRREEQERPQREAEMRQAEAQQQYIREHPSPEFQAQLEAFSSFEAKQREAKEKAAGAPQANAQETKQPQVELEKPTVRKEETKQQQQKAKSTPTPSPRPVKP